jgi:ketol-acid reductoisomerase
MKTLKRYTESDCPANALQGERVAVLGYGNLGRSFALNLRDAGVSVVVGNIEDDYAKVARKEGFDVKGIAQACCDADLVLVLLPDEVIPEVHAAEVAPNIAAGAALLFASGYCLAYDLVVPPVRVDTLLLAPRMGGEVIRERYLDRKGYYSFLSVEHDQSGKAWQRLLGIANAVGALWRGAFELNARTEANLDLFIEQTLGAAIGAAVMSAFSVGVEQGLPADALALEMYMSGEMETVWRGFRTDGFRNSATTHGPTAMFGGMLRTMQLFQVGLEEQFQKTFAEIDRGTFAEQFQAERTAGYPMLSKVLAMNQQLDPLAEAEAQVRSQTQAVKAAA